MRGLIIILVICQVLPVSAQPLFFHKQWDKRYGGMNDEGLYSFIKTLDGGFLCSGFSLSGADGDKSEPNRDNTSNTSDYWTLKINANGDKQWDKRYGGTSNDGLKAIEQTSDGGYILGGGTWSGANGDKTQPSWGGGDYWVVKVDSMGNKQWDGRFGGNKEELLTCLQQTNDGGYILGGRSASGITGDKTQENWDVSHFYYDYWLVKIDSAGNKQWDKRFGGTDDDAPSALKQTTDGGYIVVGSSRSGVSGDKTEPNQDTIQPITFDIWIVKTDSLGNLQWDKSLGTPYEDEMDYVKELSGGGYLLAGPGYRIMKIDSLGSELWEQVFPAGSYFSSFSFTNDDGYLFGGYTSLGIVGVKTENNLGFSQSWIVKSDSLGYKQWDKTIFTTGDDDGGYAVQTSDGCYAVANNSRAGIGGYKTIAAWDSSMDFFIVKFCMDTVTDLSPNLTFGEGEIQVYPNPFTNDLSIGLKGENIHEAVFTITSLIGQVIYSSEENNLATGYTKMLDLSWLANGVYFVSMVYDGVVTTQKVVKQ